MKITVPIRINCLDFADGVCAPAHPLTGRNPSPLSCELCKMRRAIDDGPAVVWKRVREIEADGFDASALWGELHAKTRDFAGTAEEFAAWLNGWLVRVPCGSCRDHARQWIEANPPAGDLFAWSVRFHNFVNARLDKPSMSEAAARAMWIVSG